MGKLKVIPPLAITEAMLVSTTVPETDYAAWNSGTTYALGDRVIRTATHKVYESAQAANTNHTPETSPEWWLEVGATNRWSMFDGSVSRATAQATSISVTLRPGVAVSALAAINLAGCTAVRVRVQDATYGTLYDVTTPLSPIMGESSWWSWFFGRRRARTQLIVADLPHIPSADILVDFTGGADLAVGVLMIGQRLDLGFSVRPGARLGLQDYSRKETNDFGDTVLVRRAYARRAEFEVLILRAEVDPALDLLAELRATPCLWIASDSYEAATVYGFYKGGDVLIAYRNHSVLSIDIEGLT